MGKHYTGNRLSRAEREKQKQDFLKAQNKCYLCGKALDTYIEYLPQTYFVVEKAQCHSCMTVVRAQKRSLQ